MAKKNKFPDQGRNFMEEKLKSVKKKGKNNPAEENPLFMAQMEARKAMLETMPKSLEEELAESPAQEGKDEKSGNSVPQPPQSFNPTKLLFFKQYNTYQGLFEISVNKENDAAANYESGDIFRKTVLHLANWLRERVGDSLDAYAELAFLRTDYPVPEDYKSFDVTNTKNINGLGFIELEIAYLEDKKAWLCCFPEPAGNLEGKEVKGRTFKTEILVYDLGDSAVLGVRQSCREPDENVEDAKVIRPGLVRRFFVDPELTISEYGLKEYPFLQTPVKLNGKSEQDCRKIREELIYSDNRQMPVIFITEKYYDDEANHEDVLKKTGGLLGFGHVVVVQKSNFKLFTEDMEKAEIFDVPLLKDALANDKVICIRSGLRDWRVTITDTFTEAYNTLREEPLRRYCDFKGYKFKPSWWEFSDRDGTPANDLDGNAVVESYKAEVDRLKIANDETKKDADRLQDENGELKRQLKSLNNQYHQIKTEFDGNSEAKEKAEKECREIREKNKELEKSEKKAVEERRNLAAEMEKRYKPLVNLPEFGLDKADEILDWIRKYYSDCIVIHPDAVKSFKKNERNIAWRRFCLLIHYLYGYTLHRNNGGMVFDKNAARDFDPAEYGICVDPVSTGSGATEMHKEDYEILLDEEDGKGPKTVIMDLHLKYGKGSDANMVRVYFYYSPTLKKSVIGYMPGHLKTRKDSH